MKTDKKHINQSSEFSALRNEVSDLKAMLSVMQEIIINQNKQVSDIHKSLFNNPIKSKDILKEERKQVLKSKILMKNLRK